MGQRDFRAAWDHFPVYISMVGGMVIYDIKLAVLIDDIRMDPADSGIAADTIIHMTDRLADMEHGLIHRDLFMIAAANQIRFHCLDRLQR